MINMSTQELIDEATEEPTLFAVNTMEFISRLYKRHCQMVDEFNKLKARIEKLER